MGDPLSADVLKHIQDAQRALFASLDYDTPKAWLEAAIPHVQALMGADHVYAVLPHDGDLLLAGSNLDPAFLDELRTVFEGIEDGRFGFDDPMLLEMHLQRRREGAGVYHELQLADRATIEQSPSHQELFVPHGLRYTTGLSVPLPVGEALICAAFESPDAPGYDPAAGRRLTLLLPAFEAGIEQWRRLAPARTDFTSLLDSLSDAMVLYNADGNERYRNRALRSLLTMEPDAGALLRTARTLANATRNDPVSLAPARHRLGLTGGRYRLRLSRTPFSLFDAKDRLVLVERESPYPSPTALCIRSGLTPREAEVALLLARGLSNDDLAERLHISPHTARHHVQKVLCKLDCPSRAGVAHTLLSPDP